MQDYVSCYIFFCEVIMSEQTWVFQKVMTAKVCADNVTYEEALEFVKSPECEWESGEITCDCIDEYQDDRDIY